MLPRGSHANAALHNLPLQRCSTSIGRTAACELVHGGPAAAARVHAACHQRIARSATNNPPTHPHEPQHGRGGGATVTAQGAAGYQNRECSTRPSSMAPAPRGRATARHARAELQRGGERRYHGGTTAVPWRAAVPLRAPRDAPGVTLCGTAARQGTAAHALACAARRLERRPVIASTAPTCGWSR
jgi:hypothetical protein